MPLCPTKGNASTLLTATSAVSLTDPCMLFPAVVPRSPFQPSVLYSIPRLSLPEQCFLDIWSFTETGLITQTHWQRDFRRLQDRAGAFKESATKYQDGLSNVAGYRYGMVQSFGEYKVINTVQRNFNKSLNYWTLSRMT